MKTPTPRSGFTLVELLAGMLIATLLALATCALLYYAHRELRRNRDGIGMQQDGRVAMETIGHLLRPLHAGAVSIVSASELRATAPGGAARVYASDGTLFVAPPAAPERPLVCGRLRAAGFTNTPAGVQVTLTLTAGDNTFSETLQEVFSCRN
jgi:prepilin-type N-terminal cleavage/methylation domain-containing protein